MLLVRLMRGGAVEAEAKLEQGDLRIGRASDNEIALQDPDKTLSRHHAELRQDGDRWIYLDLNSANGSWIGERRVTRIDLIPGIAITLGDYQLTMARVEASLEDTAAAADATQILRRDPAETLRPVPAAPAPAAAVAKPAAAPPPMVGGAVSVGAAAPSSAPQSMTPIRRIIIFGSIAVFGAFAVVIALLLRPDDEAPVAETTAATSAPAPAEAPPATPAPPVAAPSPSAETVTPPAAGDASGAPAAKSEPATEVPPAVAPPVVAPPVAAPPPARPAADADPDAAAIPARPGETAAALQQRRNDVRRRYTLALRQLAAGQFAPARDLLAGLAKEAPRFRDVTPRLTESEEGLSQQSKDAFAAAAKLEESAQWTEAITAYEQLRPQAAALPELTEAIERTRKKMHEAGADALTRARQYDSRGRVPEAIAWYQRAVSWLPPDHPGLEAAKQRLAQLVNRP